MSLDVEVTDGELIVWHPVGDNQIDADLGVTWDLREEIGITADHIEVVKVQGANVFLKDEHERGYKINLNAQV